MTERQHLLLRLLADPHNSSARIGYGGHEAIQAAIEEIASLTARLAATEDRERGLRRACAPFARVARGIPDNWPRNCVLVREERHRSLGYLAEGEGCGEATIGDYRDLLAVMPAGPSTRAQTTVCCSCERDFPVPPNGRFPDNDPLCYECLCEAYEDLLRHSRPGEG